MNTIPASEYPPEQWPRPSRLRKPYTFHQIRVVADDSPPTRHRAIESERDWQLAVQHLKGPVNPYLSRLVPGDHESILRFAEGLGLDELMIWGMSLEGDDLNDPWYQIGRDLRYLTNGVAEIPQSHITEAWALSALAFREEQTRLREAYAYAAGSEGADKTIRYLRDTLRPRSVHLKSRGFPHPEINLVTWPVKPVDDMETLAIVEAPADILARAWLELYDDLQVSGAPKFCDGCRVPFIGAGEAQRFCTRECQLQTYGRERRNRDGYRREYERMYQKKRRGTITDTEFAAWKKRQGRE